MINESIDINLLNNYRQNNDNFIHDLNGLDLLGKINLLSNYFIYLEDLCLNYLELNSTFELVLKKYCDDKSIVNGLLKLFYKLSLTLNGKKVLINFHELLVQFYYNFNGNENKEIVLNLLIKLSLSNNGDNDNVHLVDRIEDDLINSVSVTNENFNFNEINLESLTLLSLDYKFCLKLFKNHKFLISLVNLKVDEQNQKLSLLNIYKNLLVYPKNLNETEVQIDKLKKFSNNQKDENESKLYLNFASANERNELLITLGLCNNLSHLVKNSSLNNRRLLSVCYLFLTNNVKTRNILLSQGIIKSLLIIIFKLPTQLEFDDLCSIQALAKLTITTIPTILYPPPLSNTSLSFIKPFVLLLSNQSSTQLQQFESLLALTNVSSLGMEQSEVISTIDHNAILTLTENLLLSNHYQLQRGSIELICNLITFSPTAFDHWSNEHHLRSNKIQLLLALCDDDFEPIRLASSGTLAQLTMTSDTVSKFLLKDPKRLLKILINLLNDDSFQLIHRALSILCSISSSCKTLDDQSLEIINSSNLMSTLTSLISKLKDNCELLDLLRTSLINLKSLGVNITNQ